MRIKRTHALVAAVGLLAGPVLAQSSVRVYGVLDAALVYGKGSLGNQLTLGGGQNISSRLGFAGSEDLGGGLRASFALEAGLNNDNGSGATTSLNNQASGAAGGGGLAFNRQSWLGLQSRGLGELRLGRNYTPTFRSYIAYDPFNGGGIGVSQAAMGAIAAYGHPAGLRASNAIEYWSVPTMPVRVHFMHALGETPSSAGATRSDGAYTGARVSYVAHGLDVGASYARYRLFDSGDLRETVLGAKYKFGTVTLNAMYTRNTTGTAGEMDGYLVGGSYRSGPFELRTSFSTSERENAAGASIASVRKFAISPTYHLSKRTSVYALYAQTRNADGAAATPWPGTTPTGADGRAQTLAVGVVHSF